jgi:hypothetical protein
MTRALMLAAVLALSACATAAPYGPAAKPGGPGYSELRIENDRYRVTYRGAPNEIAASDYALLRAADLTLAQGYDHFIVDNRFSERQGNGSGPRVSIGGGTASIGGNTSVGIGTSVGFNLGQGAKTSLTLEIRMGRGPKPANANAYDARDVKAMISARL